MRGRGDYGESLEGLYRGACVQAQVVSSAVTTTTEIDTSYGVAEHLRAQLALTDTLLDELLKDPERRNAPSVDELLTASVQIQKQLRVIDRRIG